MATNKDNMPVDKNMTAIGIVIFLLIIIGAVYMNRVDLGITKPNSTPVVSGLSKYDALAKCLSEKGVKMYGAFTCSYCTKQKELFGSSFQYVNYQECTVDGQSGTFAQVCQDAGIRGYPTWKFPDGKVVEGELTFAKLSQFSGCPLP